MVGITYIGPLPCGRVRSADGRESVPFKRGELMKCSQSLARELVTNWPDLWRLDEVAADALQKEILQAAKES